MKVIVHVTYVDVAKGIGLNSHDIVNLEINKITIRAAMDYSFHN